MSLRHHHRVVSASTSLEAAPITPENWPGLDLMVEIQFEPLLAEWPNYPYFDSRLGKGVKASTATALPTLSSSVDTIFPLYKI